MRRSEQRARSCSIERPEQNGQTNGRTIGREIDEEEEEEERNLKKETELAWPKTCQQKLPVFIYIHIVKHTHAHIQQPELYNVVVASNALNYIPKRAYTVNIHIHIQVNFIFLVSFFNLLGFLFNLDSLLYYFLLFPIFLSYFSLLDSFLVPFHFRDPFFSLLT